MKEISCNDSAIDMIAQVLEEMKTAAGSDFSLEKINLAELSRRTGITRQRLRTLQKNGFQPVEHGNSGQRLKFTVLDGYTAIIDNLLKLGVTNSTVAAFCAVWRTLMRFPADIVQSITDAGKRSVLPTTVSP